MMQGAFFMADIKSYFCTKKGVELLNSFIQYYFAN